MILFFINAGECDICLQPGVVERYCGCKGTHEGLCQHCYQEQIQRDHVCRTCKQRFYIDNDKIWYIIKYSLCLIYWFVMFTTKSQPRFYFFEVFLHYLFYGGFFSLYTLGVLSVYENTSPLHLTKRFFTYYRPLTFKNLFYFGTLILITEHLCYQRTLTRIWFGGTTFIRIFFYYVPSSPTIYGYYIPIRRCFSSIKERLPSFEQVLCLILAVVYYELILKKL